MPSDNEAHTETYRGYHIAIEYDCDPQNPRDRDWFDSATTMVCFHGRYSLGDEHSYGSPTEAVADVCGIDQDDLDMGIGDCKGLSFTEALNKAHIIWLPLYLYDHSGITISTTPFSCPWDSGQVGFIYITLEKAKETWPLTTNESEEDYLERVKKFLQQDVTIYDHYLTNNIYGYIIKKHDSEQDEPTGDEIDSCWGFYGDYDEEGGALIEARSVVDGLVNKEA